MTIIHSLILGLVEGFTEFLPISSTAHLILTSKILGLDQSAFVKTFEIAIQSGAILAVIIVYWRKFLDMDVSKKVITAFIPTAVIGFILYKFIKEYLIGNIAVVLWALAIGGVLIIIFEKIQHKTEPDDGIDIKSLSYKKSIYIGIAQSLAVIPGVSRSAATIVGGMFAGMSRAAVVEFSFLLAIPTILAATGYDILKNYSAFSVDQFGTIAVGFVAAFVTALFGIKFLLSYIRKHSFVVFGAYRIILVIIFILIFV